MVFKLNCEFWVHTPCKRNNAALLDQYGVCSAIPTGRLRRRFPGRQVSTVGAMIDNYVSNLV